MVVTVHFLIIHTNLLKRNLMADNYLEKQYEEYEARKAAWEKARKYGKKKMVTHTGKTKQEDKVDVKTQKEADL